MSSQRPRKSRLPVLLVVLGVLVAMWIVPNVRARMSTGGGNKTPRDLRGIDAALEEYAAANGGRYPATLDALVTPDGNGHTFLDRATLPLDSWKRPYVYLPPSEGEPRPRVVCLGADGRPGGEGDAADVDSWSLRVR